MISFKHFKCKRYSIYTKYLPLRPKFCFGSPHDPPFFFFFCCCFFRYRAVDNRIFTEWPRNDHKHPNLKSTHYTESEWYQSLTAHQHQKGHTVPKQVIMIATSIQVTTVSTALCESIRYQAKSEQNVWQSTPYTPITYPRGPKFGQFRSTSSFLDKNKFVENWKYWICTQWPQTDLEHSILKKYPVCWGPSFSSFSSMAEIVKAQN